MLEQACSTTILDMVRRIKKALQETHSFQLGDSADQLSRSMWKDFFVQMDRAIEGKISWTLVLTDPLANSFIAPPADADASQEDPKLRIEDYERSKEEDAEFGIDHLKAHGTGLEAELEGVDLSKFK